MGPALPACEVEACVSKPCQQHSTWLPPPPPNPVQDVVLLLEEYKRLAKVFSSECQDV